MTDVTISPKYISDLNGWSNNTCSPELAQQITERATRFVATTDLPYVDVLIMSTPKLRRKFRRDGNKLVTTVVHGRLIIPSSTHFMHNVRTFGVDRNGRVYVSRDYPEIRGKVFLCLHPLPQAAMDPGVLESELLPLLLP